MHLASLVSGFLFLISLFSSTFAEETVTEPEPELKVTGSFPSDNPFGLVVNGERNTINLIIENDKQNLTLLSVAGSFHHLATDRLLRNTTATKFGVKLPEGDKFPVEYPFYSQFKPGDIRLKVWLEVAGETQYRVSAYESIVTIVEPEISILDWKPWTTYLIVFGALGGGAYFTYFKSKKARVAASSYLIVSDALRDGVYFIYLLYTPKPEKARGAASFEVSAVVLVVATTSRGYEEEWIPEHHLKKTKKSGANTRRRRGRR